MGFLAPLASPQAEAALEELYHFPTPMLSKETTWQIPRVSHRLQLLQGAARSSGT